MNKVAPETTQDIPRNMSIDSGVQLSVQDEPPGVIIDTDVLNSSGKRIPKRILHFCDGTLEEYSSDDEDNSDSEKQVSTVHLSDLPWGSWLLHQSMFLGNKALSACDYIGETLATIFGLTAPKYEFEIEHYKRVQAEEEEKKRQAETEMAGWTSPPSSNVEVSQAKSINGVYLEQVNETKP